MSKAGVDFSSLLYLSETLSSMFRFHVEIGTEGIRSAIKMADFLSFRNFRSQSQFFKFRGELKNLGSRILLGTTVVYPELLITSVGKH
jgi:hypothetical protein